MKKDKFIIFAVVLLITTGIIFYWIGFQLKGNEQVEVAYGEHYHELGVTANFFFLPLNSFVHIENSIDESKIGTYEVTYHLPFKTLTRTVIVKDGKAPEIVLKGNSEVTVSFGKRYEEEGYTATDDYDGDITSRVTVTSNVDYQELGTYEIIYRVTDSSVHATTITRKVHIVDDVAPEIILTGSEKYYVQLGTSYEEPGYDAIDNYDKNVRSKVKVTSNVNTEELGTYEVTYEVEDSFHNKTTKKRKVIVQEDAVDKDKNIKITKINDILLVNKTHPLPSTYNPKTDKTAKEALTALQNAAKKDGYSMPLLSGFRSYSTQKELYNNYVKEDGEKLANTYSAKPGQSEHQTGLAFDVGEIDDDFGNKPAGIWLQEHAHEYGFIIRYLKGKEKITGYKYEPWHIRYVGVEVATQIHKQGITLEEYLNVE